MNKEDTKAMLRDEGVFVNINKVGMMRKVKFSVKDGVVFLILEGTYCSDLKTYEFIKKLENYNNVVV